MVARFLQQAADGRAHITALFQHRLAAVVLNKSNHNFIILLLLLLLKYHDIIINSAMHGRAGPRDTFSCRPRR